MMLAMLVPCWTGVVGEEGEFMAGSFILTQRALDEAPYRYSSFLTQALEKMEMKDPPAKSDEQSCSVKYRIEPWVPASGRFAALIILSPPAWSSHVCTCVRAINHARSSLGLSS